MNELKLRSDALDMALRTAHTGEDESAILDRARDYFQFISGKSPDHRQPPAALSGA